MKNVESIKRFEYLKAKYEGKFVKHTSQIFDDYYYVITKMTLTESKKYIFVDGYDIDFVSINIHNISRDMTQATWEDRVKVIS